MRCLVLIHTVCGYSAAAGGAHYLVACAFGRLHLGKGVLRVRENEVALNNAGLVLVRNRVRIELVLFACA